ncbi:MAG: alpha/beta fold hydrolase [Alphaproteobacteria bacterium]|nr:alpha/beta fold hydrolase [Alphaproteobacteria bacterium]
MVRLPRLLRLALLLLLLGLAACWGLGEFLVRPTPADVPAAAPPAVDLHLRATDGLVIAATFRPGRTPSSPAVLLLHGNGASRAAMAATGELLARRGYASLAIDFRGHGQSAAAPHSFGLFESRDAEAALRWLKARQHGARVAVVGLSLGGAAALVGEHGPLAADALAVEAVYPDIRHAIRNRIAAFTGAAPAALLEPLLSLQARPRFGAWPSRLSPIDAARRFGGPVFVIGGGADRYTPPDETRGLYAAFPGPKRLHLMAGKAHAGVGDIADPAYRSALLSFLAGAIGAP